MAELLDHVQRGDQRRFEDFCISLKKSGQEHISKMLDGEQAGEDTTDAACHDADDTSLSKLNNCKLMNCYNSLIDRINSDDEFLGTLQQHKVFSDLQIRKLRASNFIESWHIPVMCSPESSNAPFLSSFM